MNTANALSLGRIFAIPLFMLAFLLPWHQSHFIAALIFAFAAFTDWLDGYLARNLEQATSFGAFIDPLADKLMVVVALIMIVSQYPTVWVAVPAAIIAARELIVSGLREWMALQGKGEDVAVSRLGKIKTTVQMLALLLLILYQADTVMWIEYLGYILLYVATGLTLWTLWSYLKKAWPDLTL